MHLHTRKEFLPRLMAAMFLVAASQYGFAADASPVTYIGGTAPGIPHGAVGELLLSDPHTLVYRAPAGSPASTGSIEIPYSDVTRYSYEKIIKHHLGVLPAIAVGLVAARQHEYHITITYLGKAHTNEVAVFDVPSDEPAVLLAVLHSRAAQACEVSQYAYQGGCKVK